MDIRTDLALEKCENLDETTLSGVTSDCYTVGNMRITHIEITDSDGAKALGKPIGKYITAETEPFAKFTSLDTEEAEAVGAEIRSLIPETGTVLVAGLGNLKITPDSYGAKCAEMIFSTRHIKGEILKTAPFSNLRSVCSFATGVMGDTGAEAGEIIRGLVNELNPVAVIAVDALAARNVKRLGNTVQICNTGIVPGSGVGNSRAEISEKTVGVPVIAVGVPTVTDAAALIYDFAGKSELSGAACEMMVTPREVDLMIEHASKLTALAINRALQPGISAEDLNLLTS